MAILLPLRFYPLIRHVSVRFWVYDEGVGQEVSTQAVNDDRSDVACNQRCCTAQRRVRSRDMTTHGDSQTVPATGADRPDTTIRPFRIEIPQTDLDDLQ